MPPSHVTRIAPSPTGMLHIATARTALFNYLIARATGGRFILRVDDTDAARNDEAAVAVIDDALAWLGLAPDLRVRQSDRLALYARLADALLGAGLAVMDGGAVRLAPAPADAVLSWEDTVSGTIAVSDHDRRVSDGLVLMRSDGAPTYHFASVVDDMDLGVTWVVRGIDHMSNTAKHLAVWRALSLVRWHAAARPQPLWTHLGLITQNGRKMSKRDGAASLLSYRDAGVDPDVMCNFLLRIGWGPAVDDRTTKTIDRATAISLFLAGGRMRSSSASMDPAHLAALDRKYKAAAERNIRAASSIRVTPS